MTAVPCAQHAASAPRGFTLLELLLALVITGITAGVLYASLAIAFNAREATRQEVDASAAGRNALGLVRDDLAGTLQPSGILAGAFIGADATGPEGYPADELSYVTNHAMRPTVGEAPGELKNVELRLADPNDRHLSSEDSRESARRLVRDITTNLLARTEPDPTRQTLARGVVSLNIRYHDGTEWRDDWDSGQRDNTLPSRVAITLRILPHGIPADTANLEDELITVRREFAPLMAPNASQREQRQRQGGR